MSKNATKWGLMASVVIVSFAGTANADDLLIIDLTVANQVTISATQGLSAITASGPDTIGVYFDQFYNGAGSSLTATLVSGNITNFQNPSDFTPSLFRGGAGADTGLNLWSFSSAATVTFTAGQQAFTGSGTWNLSAAMYNDMLNGNQSGDLYFPADTADDISSAVLLGTWRVVPTPSALSLLGIGLGMGAARRRR